MTNEEIAVLLDTLSKRLSKIENYLERNTFKKFSNPEPGQDELYSQTLDLIKQHETMSVSMLQRRLGIGFNHAANLIEELENNGIVGPADGSKPRKVLIK